MSRLISLILLILIIYFLIRSAFKPVKRPASETPSNDQGPAGSSSEMIQDPQCGTYVDPADAVKAVIDGRTYYFCSAKCLEQFQKKSGHSG